MYYDKLETYKEACKKFSHETAEWRDLDNNKMYVATGSTWCETCDNCENGLNCEWAFHKTPEQIEARTEAAFYNMMQSSLDLAMSDGWDAEQVAEAMKLFF